MHLHDFLSAVHNVVQPQTYLEVGVQFGYSLGRAYSAKTAIGVDPFPQCGATGNQIIYSQASDDFFSTGIKLLPEPTIVDFGFIDGLHLYEQALNDFINMEHLCMPHSVIIMDDVLPRNQVEANRTQCPGDWTGDVWKVTQILLRYRPELKIVEVNTQPTGTLLVYGFHAQPPTTGINKLRAHALSEYMELDAVPEGVINRAYAVAPEVALSDLKGWFDEQRMGTK
jgi:hypothetical protein